MVEHIATFSAVGQHVDKLVDDLEGQQSEEKILAVLQKSKEFIRRIFYGKKTRGESSRTVQAIHVNDLLNDLEKEVNKIKDVYEFLCEFVHPNYGSNKLVSTGRLASGKLRPTEEYAKADLDVIRRCCSEGFNYVQCEGYIHHAALGRLHALLDLCFVKGANPSNVFSVKAPKPMGDGKNKRTAYYFKNARTTAEAIKLTYQFFKKSGIGIIGQKEIG